MPTRKTLFVFFLTVTAAFLHFYNLNWGAPLYFHPDERNIASSVSQLQFPENMNPKFFAYGSLPIFTIYYTGLLANSIGSCQLLWDSCEKSSVSFSQAIVISRFYSALFSTLLVPLLFFLGKKIKNEGTGFIAAFLATTSIGFIQFAHFGTFEMWLTLLGVLLFWCCVEAARKKAYAYVLWSAILFGALIATKVSSIVLLPLPLLAILIRHIPKNDWTQIKAWMLMRGLAHATKDLLIFIVIILLSYFVTNPYVQFDNKGYTDSIRYESGVALGTLPVFYTAEFFDTSPILFQLLNVFPFLLNPLIFLIAIPSFIYFAYQAKKNKLLPYFFIMLFFLFLLIPQAILFVKWTRYMVPTLPFLYLIVALAFSAFIAHFKLSKQTTKAISLVGIIICSLFALSYFITAFIQPDTRISAASYAQKVIPRNAYILSEVYDLGIVPFNSSYPSTKLYNFYDLDSNSLEFNEQTLNEELAKADYIILPSQRVIKSRLLQKERFPVGHKFYTNLFNGNLGFKKIYETPCDVFCQITYLGSPSFKYEQTANVFDRPTVYIFKKM
jgi:4-amino-4-deoxy-L-arabinose transferase-like glycosyltransferase